MVDAARHDDLGRAATILGRLPASDRQTAAALAATMSGWNAAELDDYRSSVLEELAASQGPARGFLAVEVAALATFDSAGA